MTGSNLLLHRIFIEKGLPEELQFISFDSETNLCPAIYVSSCCSLPPRMTNQLFTFTFSVVCYNPNALVIIATVRHSRTLNECTVTANSDIHREIWWRKTCQQKWILVFCVMPSYVEISTTTKFICHYVECFFSHGGVGRGCRAWKCLIFVIYFLHGKKAFFF